MAQLVVTYPKLSPDDEKWIATFRSHHDEMYASVIKPHYTLVFPTEKAISRDELRQHVENQLTAEFDTRCTKAQVVYNQFKKKWHVFLVPDEGYDKIVDLHDRLYTGLLEDQLHPTEPFLPHIGIATLERKEACEELANALNERGVNVRAPVTYIDVCTYVEGESVVTFESLPLRRNVTIK